MGPSKGGAPKGGPKKKWAPKGGEPRRVEPRRVEGPKFRAIFPSSRHNFLFSFSLLGSFRGIVVFEAPGH